MRCALLLLLLILPFSARAQVIPRAEPFSTISIAAGGTYNVSRSVIHDFWKPGYGGELSLSTPFYFGQAEAGGAFHTYDVADPSVPRFDAILLFAGWGVAVSPIPYFSWYNGFRLGNNRMTFDDDTFPGIRTESEFMLGLNSRLDLLLLQGVGVFGSASLSQTYTFIRFRTVYVTAGLTYRAPSPEWVKSFLR